MIAMGWVVGGLQGTDHPCLRAGLSARGRRSSRPTEHRHSVSRLSFLRSAQMTESAESVSADALQQQQGMR